MVRIASQGDEKYGLAVRVLGWLSHAPRHLKTIELQYALALMRDTKEINEEDKDDPNGEDDLGDADNSDSDEDNTIDEGSLIPEAILISVCGGIVTVDESNTIRLVHETTEKYLKLKRVREERFPHFERTIVMTCLTQLSVVERPCSKDMIRTQKYQDDEAHQEEEDINVFLHYAARYWPDHLMKADTGWTMNDQDSEALQSLKLFLSDRRLIILWLAICSSNFHRESKILVSFASMGAKIQSLFAEESGNLVEYNIL